MTIRAKHVLLLMAALAGGCQPDGSVDSQLGELGRVSFSYQRSCFFGCPLEQPLLSGTRERIGVTGAGDRAGVQARSGNSEVAELAVERDCFCERDDDVGGRIEVAEDARCEAPRVKHCENTILVHAKAAGDAPLELRNADNRLIDRTTLLVREAVRARFRGTLASQLGAREASSFEFNQGDTLDLELTLFDARGRALLAPEGVRWRSSDEAVASVSAFLKAGGAELEAGPEVVVHGNAAGDAEIRVEVPGLEASVDCRVLGSE